jgi:hypothetical protein
MTSYRVEVRQCADCGCQFKTWAFASRNMFGVKFYTDGFVDGSMYDEGSALRVCPECSKWLWQEDLPALESKRDFLAWNDPRLSALPGVETVRGRAYEDALRQAIWTNDAQEKYVRIRAWWSFNDAYRGQVDDQSSLPTEQEENLLSLLKLLRANHWDDRITKAEIFRELGQFDECLEELDQLRKLQSLSQLIRSDLDDQVITWELINDLLDQFGECLNELDLSRGDGYLPVMDTIESLARSRKRRVAPLE